MTNVEVTTEEARLIGLSRAIKEYDNPVLVTIDDVGDTLTSLEAVFNMKEKEEEYGPKELKAFLLGFIGGLAATRIPELIAEQEARAYQEMAERGYPLPQYTQPPDDQVEQTEFIGGPSGGVAVGQGEDPNLVTQTGPRPEEKDDGK